MKRQAVRPLQKYVLNPPVKAVLALDVVPATERSRDVRPHVGQARCNPVANGLDYDGRTFWIVAEQGRHVGYVKNLLADPHVRVKVGLRGGPGGPRSCPTTTPRPDYMSATRPTRQWCGRWGPTC